MKRQQKITENRKHPQVDIVRRSQWPKYVLRYESSNLLCFFWFFFLSWLYTCMHPNQSESVDRMNKNQNVHWRTFISWAAIEVFCGSCFAFAFHFSLTLWIVRSLWPLMFFTFFLPNTSPFGIIFTNVLFSFCSVLFLFSFFYYGYWFVHIFILVPHFIRFTIHTPNTLRFR